MKKPTKAEIAAAEAARRAKVDRLGELDAEFAAMDPKVKEAKALREEITGWADKYPAEQSVIFGGNKFQAMCSERKNQRSINKAGLRALVGDDAFFEIATVALGEADGIAKSVPNVALCISTARTGNRSVDTFAKVA